MKGLLNATSITWHTFLFARVITTPWQIIVAFRLSLYQDRQPDNGFLYTAINP